MKIFLANLSANLFSITCLIGCIYLYVRDYKTLGVWFFVAAILSATVYKDIVKSKEETKKQVEDIYKDINIKIKENENNEPYFTATYVTPKDNIEKE